MNGISVLALLNSTADVSKLNRRFFKMMALTDYTNNTFFGRKWTTKCESLEDLIGLCLEILEKDMLDDMNEDILTDSDDDSSTSTIPNRLSALKYQKFCKICQKREADVVFLPCGHLCCCNNCCEKVKKCPNCDTGIKKTIRTYLV